MRRVSVYSGAAVTALSVLLLTGCASSQPPEFAREQTTEDVVPAVASDAERTILAETTRFAGEVEGYEIYLARSAESDGLCLLLVVADTGEWESTGCGNGGGSVGVGMQLSEGTRIEAGDFRYPDAGERTQLSDSVWVVTE